MLVKHRVLLNFELALICVQHERHFTNQNVTMNPQIFSECGTALGLGPFSGQPNGGSETPCLSLSVATRRPIARPQRRRRRVFGRGDIVVCEVVLLLQRRRSRPRRALPRIPPSLLWLGDL